MYRRMEMIIFMNIKQSIYKILLCNRKKGGFTFPDKKRRE